MKTVKDLLDTKSSCPYRYGFANYEPCNTRWYENFTTITFTELVETLSPGGFLRVLGDNHAHKQHKLERILIK